MTLEDDGWKLSEPHLNKHRNIIADATMSDVESADLLSGLPQPVLWRLWPKDRLDVGVRTCWVLRKELVACIRHLSAVVCGQLDAGKSTLAGRLLVELGSVAQRELRKAQSAAEQFDREACAAYTFLLDESQESRSRGLTLSCASRRCCTSMSRYTLLDTPGTQDFVGSMICGAIQADVGILVVPADSSALEGMAKKPEGMLRMHARLLSALGVRNLIVCVNKMDAEPARYQQDLFREITSELRNMLSKLGWNADSVPFIPVSSSQGDNITSVSTNMPWWNGVDVCAVRDRDDVGTSNIGNTVHVNTLVEAMDLTVSPRLCATHAPLRFTVHHVRRHDDDEPGHVRVSGRVEQGVLRPEDHVVFVPSSASSNNDNARTYSTSDNSARTYATSNDGNARTYSTIVRVERFRAPLEAARAGEAAVLLIKLEEVDNIPPTNSTMILAGDRSVWSARVFCAQVQVSDDLPAPIAVGAGAEEEGSSERESSDDDEESQERSQRFTALLRLAEFDCRISRVDWARNRRGRVESPEVLKPGDTAQVVFETEEKVLVCEEEEGCEWLRRVVLMRGSTVVMVGKVTGLASPTVLAAAADGQA